MRAAIPIVMAACALVLSGCGRAPAQQAAPARAADPPRSAAYHRCVNQSDGSDRELYACSAEELDRRNAELNGVYGDLAPRLEPNERKALVTAERAWIAYRDAQCDYQGAENEGGTIQPFVIEECLVDITDTRVAFLRSELAEIKSLTRP